MKAEALNDQSNSGYTEEDCQIWVKVHGEIDRLHISINGVLDQLNKLNPSKAQGPDSIPPWFLNTYAAQLAPTLHNICQLSVDSSQVPEAWKNANVTAIFKKSCRTESANYRTISLKFGASKLLEHVIHSHVMKHLELHNILTDSQHEFRAKRSTETRLIQTIHDISKSLDKKETVDMAILDLTKAFDKVPHKRLIHKLNYYGISGYIATWMEIVLIGRTQQVVVNGAASSSTIVTSGVPQGTVLGPLLFLLYIKDVPDNIYKCTALCRLLYFIYTYQNTK